MLFNLAARRRIDQLEEDKRKLQEALQAAIAANEKMQQRAFLLDIISEGRERRWTFVRNGEVHQIKTMGLMSDNLPEWKRMLIE